MIVPSGSEVTRVAPPGLAASKIPKAKTAKISSFVAFIFPPLQNDLN